MTKSLLPLSFCPFVHFLSNETCWSFISLWLRLLCCCEPLGFRKGFMPFPWSMPCYSFLNHMLCDKWDTYTQVCVSLNCFLSFASVGHDLVLVHLKDYSDKHYAPDHILHLQQRGTTIFLFRTIKRKSKGKYSGLPHVKSSLLGRGGISKANQ